MDAEALLIVELDGPEVEVDELIQRVEMIARDNTAQSVRISSSEDGRNNFWPAARRSRPWGEFPRLLLHGQHHPAPSPVRCVISDD